MKILALDPGRCETVFCDNAAADGVGVLGPRHEPVAKNGRRLRIVD